MSAFAAAAAVAEGAEASPLDARSSPASGGGDCPPRQRPPSVTATVARPPRSSSDRRLILFMAKWGFDISDTFTFAKATDRPSRREYLSGMLQQQNSMQIRLKLRADAVPRRRRNSLHHFESVRSPSPSLLSQVRRRGRRRRQWGRRRGGRRRRRRRPAAANLRGRGGDLVCSPPPSLLSHGLRNASVHLSVLFSSLMLSTRCAVFLQIWNSGCTLCELRRTLPPYRLSRTATEGRAAPSGRRTEEIGKEGRRKRRDGESISPRARLRWPRWKSAHNILHEIKKQ